MFDLRSAGRWLAQPANGLDVIRIYLGIGLFVRGALFVTRPEQLSHYLEVSHGWALPYAITHFVIVAHLFGGLLLALGLATRAAAAAQVPPLLGAVFLVHLREGLLSVGQSLEFAALVLALLAVFSVFGAGRFSLDYWLAKRQWEVEEETGVPHESTPEFIGRP